MFSIGRDRLQREIFRALMVQGPMTRAQLAEQLDISRASVTRFSTPLIDDGLVEESEDAVGDVRGRPNRPLRVNASSRRYLGCKVTGTELSAVLTDLAATSLGTAVAHLQATTPAAVVDAVVDIRKQLAGDLPIAGVGVALAGLVSGAGHVEHADFIEWVDVPFGDLLRDAGCHGVVVENDVVALTVAEQWFGSGRGCDNFALVTIGAGVGYGLVAGGQVVDTRRAREGLLGHIPLWEKGPRCSAGHPGCSSAYLTTPNIEQQLAAATRGRVTRLEDVYGATSGPARRVLDQCGYALGRLLAEVGCASMADRIILSGEGAPLFEAAHARVMEGLRRYSPARIDPPDVVVDLRGFELWARGAAAAAIQHAVLTR